MELETQKGKSKGGKVFEQIRTEIFPNMVKPINLQIKEDPQTTNRINTHACTCMYMHMCTHHKDIIKLLKISDQEKILKAVRGERDINRGIKIRDYRLRF